MGTSALGTTQNPSSQTRCRSDGFASQSRLVEHWFDSAVLRMTEHPAASRERATAADRTLRIVRTPP
jgi:hypothetical protein